MPISATTLRILMAAGLDGETLIEAVEAIDRDMESAAVSRQSVDAVAERRRAYDRERKRRGAVANWDTETVAEGASTGIPPETSTGVSTGAADANLPHTPSKNTSSSTSNEVSEEAAPSAALPTDPRELLWSEGIEHLIAMGVSDRSARSNTGRWLKAHRPEDVLGAIRRARDHGTRDPIALVGRILEPIGNRTANGRRGNLHEATDFLRDAARQAREREAREAVPRIGGDPAG